MSKSTEEFCDICGRLLYHSLHVYHRPPSSKKWTYRWFWNGSAANRETDADICADCADAVAALVNRNRKKVDKAKLAALDKTPAQMMEEAKSIKRNFKL